MRVALQTEVVGAGLQLPAEDFGGIAEFLHVTSILLVSFLASVKIKANFLKIFKKVLVVKDNVYIDRQQVIKLIDDINSPYFLLRLFCL